jgi:sterol desaturase/sphingolipid hydroxylase (fatty acid hydroxylase superfamily)
MIIPQSLRIPLRNAGAGLGHLVFGHPSTPWVPIAFFLPLAAGAVLWNVVGTPAPAWVLVTLPLVGVLLWTFLEYFLHSRGFHGEARPPGLGELRDSHLGHHADPSDPNHIVARLSYSVPIAVGLWGVCGLLLWSLRLAGLVMAGMILGYLAYEVIHYLIHRWRPARRLLRPLVRHHLYHHHKDDTRCFGVTSPLWDWILRTGPRARPAEVKQAD